jgi:primosomal protein N' (replication factor Y)
VLIQAYGVHNPAIARAAHHDFEAFAAWELERRREIGNPPFGHLALVRVTGLDAVSVTRRAEELGALARAGVEEVQRKHAGDGGVPPLRLLGPVASPIERVNRRVRWQLLVRANTRPPLRWLLRQLRPRLGEAGSGEFKTMALVDVDPQSLL